MIKQTLVKAALVPLLGLVYSQTLFAIQDDTTCSSSSVQSLTIGEVQGTGAFTPLLPDLDASNFSNAEYQTESEYAVTGIVSTVLNKSVTLYSNDNNPETSDGLYVHIEDGQLPSVGNTVCIRGVVKEGFGETQLIASDSKWALVDNTTSAPQAFDLVYNSPAVDSTDTKLSFSETLERHEGMLINLPEDMDDQVKGYQTMRVTKAFGFDFYLFNNFDERRSNIGLSYSRINLHPNMVGPAGSDASINQRAENEDYLLFLESVATADDDDIPYFPSFKSNPNNNAIRINDGVVDLSGVIRYEYNHYRIYVPSDDAFNVTNDNFIKNTPRSPTPIISNATDFDSFTVRVGTLNILNYFNSPFGGDSNPSNETESRGARSSQDFVRQTDKLVNTLFAMNSDIVGLLEVENNGFGKLSAIKALQDALNAEYDEENPIYINNADYVGNRYAFVGIDSNKDMVIDELDNIGGDAVTTGMIYRPSKVTLESAKVIPMPYQNAPIVVDANGAALIDEDGFLSESGENFQRDSLMATFIVHATGKRLTVVANHFKSKGSSCWEDWKGWESWTDFDPINDAVQDIDYQGNCEAFRVAAADQLGQYLEKVGGDRVILGDLNAYIYEDPLLLLTENPQNKIIMGARDTYIGHAKQFGSNGKKITKSYGYISAPGKKDEEKDKLSWSFSFNDEVGSLDHMLISPSMEHRLIDAVEWHINAAESGLFDYEYSGSNNGNLPYRSSDHDPAIMTLSYKYGETTTRNSEERVYFSISNNQIKVPFIISGAINALDGDMAKIKITKGLDQPIATVALPAVLLTTAGEQTVHFNVAGLEPGDYTFEMYLSRGDIISSSKMVMDATVGKSDDITPKVVIPPYDNTGGGGSVSLALLFSLLLFSRKRKHS